MKTRVWYTIVMVLGIGATCRAQVDLRPDSSTFSSPVNINSTLYNNGMQFPATDGRSGQVLTTNGNGQLQWQDPATGPADYLNFYASTCSSPAEYLINLPLGLVTDTCGVLYDTGGPQNGYGLDERETIELFTGSGTASTILRVIVQELDIEDDVDTLFIENIPYSRSLRQPDTLYFRAGTNLHISFRSNSSDPGGPFDGFAIRWEHLSFQGVHQNPDLPVGFFFHPERQSVGGGVALNQSWDSIGIRALLMGYGGQAPSEFSNSVGYRNEATGRNSTAFGFRNRAQGTGSVAVGNSNLSSASFSSTFGYNNFATGTSSTAVGYYNSATGSNSIALGHFSTASGENSVALGHSTRAPIYQLTAMGSYNDSPFGHASSWIPTDPVFMVGNGRNGQQRSTALTILKNGHVGIGTMTPTSLLHLENTSGDAQQIIDGQDFAHIDFLTSSQYRCGLGYTTRNTEDYFFLFEGGINALVSRAGEIGVRTVSPRWNFDVNGDAGKSLGGGEWSQPSDQRLKRHIRPFEDGLEKVLQIEPVFFQFNGKAGLPVGQEQIGIIAQDLQKVAPYMIKEAIFQKGQKEQTYLSYNGSAMKYLLINAIKALHSDNQEKSNRIEELEQTVSNLIKRLEQLETLVTGQSEDETPVILNGDRASLEQNIPNPFRGVTRIGYFLPEGTQRATLLVHDMQGRELQRIPLQNTGRGQLDLQTRNLTAGTYSYSLYVDGALIDSRKMVVER